jgi:hypothetical protein
MCYSIKKGFGSVCLLPLSGLGFRGLLSTSIGLFQRKDNLGSCDMKHCPQWNPLELDTVLIHFLLGMFGIVWTQEDRRLQQQKPMLGGSFMSGSFHFKWSKNSPLKEGSWLQIPNQIVGPSLCNTLKHPPPPLQTKLYDKWVLGPSLARHLKPPLWTKRYEWASVLPPYDDAYYFHKMPL